MEEQSQKTLLLMQTGDKDAYSFEEFLLLFGFSEEVPSERILKLMFEQFDIEKVGYITFDTFKEVCDNLGERYSDHELRQMIEHADRDRDNRVSYEEFVKVVTRKSRR
jgi:Ca2+-binding EF-hand superfamily protein